MKKTLAIVLALLLMLSVCLVACGEKKVEETNTVETTTPSETVQPSQDVTLDIDTTKKFTIGVSMIGLNGVNGHSLDMIMEEFEKYPNVTVYTADANLNSLTQVADVENLVTMGCDMIIIKPNDNSTLGETLRNVMKEGIKVVFFDSAVFDENGDIIGDAYFCSNDNEIGALVGEALVKLGGESGKYVMYEGVPGGSVFLDRIEGFNAYMEDYPGWEMLASQAGKINRTSDEEIMENWISAFGDSIDAVVTFADEEAFGTILGVEARGVLDLSKDGDTILISVNGLMEALPYVADGTIDYEIAVSSHCIYMSDMCYAMLATDYEFPQRIECPALILDADTAAAYIDDSAFRFDEVNPGENPLIKSLLEKYKEEYPYFGLYQYVEAK